MTGLNYNTSSYNPYSNQKKSKPKSNLGQGASFGPATTDYQKYLEFLETSTEAKATQRRILSSFLHQTGEYGPRH